MNCPFCKEQFSSQDDLQLHCLSCTSAFAEPRTSRTEASSSVVVRFRWVKSRPCLDREIHLITSLAGSVTLYWKLDEALYESDTVDVPVGEHICQLALDGDVVPTEPFVVSEDSDVIFVIVRKAHYRYTSFDESYDRGRISDEARCDDVPSVPGSTSTSDRQQPHLGMDSRHGDNESALSPLYKELLQHQLSHGEPSWVPGSGMQSPVMSDTDLSDLARQEEEEPSVLNLLPGQSEEHSPRPAEEGRPVDLSGESDGSLSLSDGRGVNEQSVSGNETEEAILRSSFSILASGHTRNSPPHSLASDGSGRDVVSPFVVEAAMPQNLSGITGDHCGEEHVTAPLSSSLQPTYSRGPVFIRATNHLPNFTNESSAECIQSTSRVSPLGSVLDAVTVSTTTEAGILENDNTTTTSTVQRRSPSASVHSSSLFSSGLPSPIMSPRGRSQSDTRVPLVFRENPPGSLPTYPVRPQSQSGFILASAAGLVSTLDGVTAHSLLSSNAPAERESPSGSAHSTSVVPQGRTDAINSYQQNDASTAVLAEVADPLDGQFFSDFGHQPKDSDTGNPTELLVDLPPKKPTMPVSSLAQQTGFTPLELSLASYEESGISTLSASRYSRGPTDIRAESNYRQGVVASRDSGNDTYPVHSPRHTTSGALSPSQLLSEAPLTLLPSTCARLDHQESQSATSPARTPEQHIALGPESSSETQPVVLHSGLSKESRGSESSGIPSNRSAFSAVTGDRDSSVGNLPSQMEVLIQERDSLASELRQRAARYEADLIRLRTRNDDLQQQLLSIETVAALTKQDNEKTKAVEQTLREKDQQISALQESMAELEKNNGQLKDEQESLKTVNELRLEDLNRLNSDLQQQLSVLRRRLVESSPAQRSRNEARIIELQVEKNTLEQRVMRLVQDNENLREQLKQAQREKGSVKARTRISKAKSETDLSRKFDKYTTYDEQNYRDLEPVAKAVTFGTRTDASGLRTSRYSLLDANNSRSYDLSSAVALNGHGSHPKRTTLSSNSTVKDILAREPVSGKVVARHRQGSLGEDSDTSDDFEHANHPRWRHTQSSVPLLSSVVSWDPVASVYEPYDRGMERRSRPHSYHGGSVHDLYSGKGDNLSTSPLHEMTSRYSKRNDDRHSSSSSNYSTTDSSLLTTTSYKSSYHKLSTKPFAPRSSSDIKLGMEVLVTRSRGQIARGKVKYVGPLPGRNETYIGIELGPGQAEGKHDGSCHGQRLFTCKPNRGIFVPFIKVVMCYGQR